MTVIYNDSLRPKGVWIYALIATSKDEKRNACYVGQTVKPIRRFKEHLLHQRPRRASAELFKWAKRESVDIRVVILSFAIGDWRFARELEGYWLRLAIEARFETPGLNGWGKNLPQSKKFPGQPDEWPFKQINEAENRLDRIVFTGIVPPELFVAPNWLKNKTITAPKQQKKTKPRTAFEELSVKKSIFSALVSQDNELPAYLSHCIRKRYSEGASIKELAQLARLNEKEVLEHLQQFTSVVQNKMQ